MGDKARLMCGCTVALATLASGCHKIGKYRVVDDVPDSADVAGLDGLDGGVDSAFNSQTPTAPSGAGTASWDAETSLGDASRSSEAGVSRGNDAMGIAPTSTAPSTDVSSHPPPTSCEYTDAGTGCATDCGWARPVGSSVECLPGGRYRQLGTEGDERYTAVAAARDGSIWMTGLANGKLPGQPTNNGGAFISGWAVDGSPLWTRQVIADDGFDVPIVTGTSSDLIVLAATQSRVGKPRAILVKAFNLDGVEVWGHSVQGAYDVEAGGIAAAPDGGVYLRGWETLGDINDAGLRPGIEVVRRYDRDGSLVWRVEVPAMVNDLHPYEVMSLTVTSGVDGSVILSNTLYHDLTMFPFGGNVGLTKLNSKGEREWQRVFDAEGELNNHTAVDAAGNILFGSRSGFDGVVHKVSSAGEPIWAVQIGPIAHQFPRVTADSDGNIYAVVTTDDRHSDDGYDGFGPHPTSLDIAVWALSSEGTLNWKTQFGTPEDERAEGIVWSGGAVYVCGETDGDLAGARGGADAFVVQVARP